MDEIKYKALNNSIEDLRLRINLEKSKIKTHRTKNKSTFIYLLACQGNFFTHCFSDYFDFSLSIVVS